MAVTRRKKPIPRILSAEDGDHVADEMFRVDQGADMGWPYTYYNSAKKIRLTAPEYDGDGKTPASGAYAAPIAAFPAHVAPMDVTFYDAKQFPPPIAAAPSSPFMARAAATRVAMMTVTM